MLASLTQQRFKFFQLLSLPLYPLRTRFSKRLCQRFVNVLSQMFSDMGKDFSISHRWSIRRNPAYGLVCLHRRHRRHHSTPVCHCVHVILSLSRNSVLFVCFVATSQVRLIYMFFVFLVLIFLYVIELCCVSLFCHPWPVCACVCLSVSPGTLCSWHKGLTFVQIQVAILYFCL